MKLQDALKLRNEDEVTVKKTKQVMQVVEIEVEHRTNREDVSVLLDDGNWYGYKEIS